MANEIELNASLRYDDSEGTEAFLEVVGKLLDVTTKKITRLKQNVGITEEALALGDVSSLGWCCLVNRDSSNYVELRSASGAGNDIIKIPAGACAIFHFGSDITTPYIIANTAACQVDVFLISQ